MRMDRFTTDASNHGIQHTILSRVGHHLILYIRYLIASPQGFNNLYNQLIDLEILSGTPHRF